MTLAVARRTLTERFETEFATSRRLHEQARGLFPNGVAHDLRHLEPFPVYIDRAQGARKWDVDGHELIDYWAGHGALLLGHGHPAVVAAVRRRRWRARRRRRSGRAARRAGRRSGPPRPGGAGWPGGRGSC